MALSVVLHKKNTKILYKESERDDEWNLLFNSSDSILVFL